MSDPRRTVRGMDANPPQAPRERIGSKDSAPTSNPDASPWLG